MRTICEAVLVSSTYNKSSIFSKNLSRPNSLQNTGR